MIRSLKWLWGGGSNRLYSADAWTYLSLTRMHARTVAQLWTHKMRILFLRFISITDAVPFVSLNLYMQKQILALVPELVNLFAQVVVSPVETAEVKAQVGRAFAHLISLYGHQMQPLLSNLSPAHASALGAFAPKSWWLIELASVISSLVFYMSSFTECASQRKRLVLPAF